MAAKAQDQDKHSILLLVILTLITLEKGSHNKGVYKIFYFKKN